MEALDPKEQSSSESPERLQEAMETEGQGEAAQESPVNPEEPTEETTPDMTEEARAAEEELTEKIKEDDELSTKDSISELSMSNTQRQTDSPVSVANSEHSSRPNKRKRKGTPTRHLEVSQAESQSDREREEVLSENLAGSPKNEIPVVLLDEAASEDKHQPTKSNPKKYAAPRLDLFGPPQHYMELFGPPMRQRTENCSVVIRGIGEEELYYGPGDKDPGEIVIPVRNTV
ncbi:unnamed protein product [Oikopleura dioica]|uniref:Uncharacterized protein n=1 Tax=Oikopleura dioica TaxID=34765 RepID=E4X4P0_OIKDI|nr:unnamed protein product [Oikopleura dioica]